MKLNTILSIAFPFAKIKEDTAGGAEQILSSLDIAITNHGYNSLVIAPEGSVVKGKLFEGPKIPDKMLDKEIRERTYKSYKQLIMKVIEKRKVDVIHFHGIDYDKYIPAVNIPILVTLHLPLSWYNTEYITRHEANIHYNCVSEYQKSNCDNPWGIFETISNGVSIPEKYLNKKRGNYTLSMGRICPEKGYHIAFDAAIMARIPHLHAGSVFPYKEHIKYYREMILPRCENFRYRFVGSAGIREKKRLFSSAKCLLIPSLVPETSSLVALEAMSFGTPVIAFNVGALKEIVKNGYNGYLVNNTIEMAKAINSVHMIDPYNCYRFVKEKYSIDKMVNQYFMLYYKMSGCTGLAIDINKGENGKIKKCA